MFHLSGASVRVLSFEKRVGSCEKVVGPWCSWFGSGECLVPAPLFCDLSMAMCHRPLMGVR